MLLIYDSLWNKNYTTFDEMTRWTYIPLAKVWWMEERLKGLKETVYVILYNCAIRSTLKFSTHNVSQFTDKATNTLHFRFKLKYLTIIIYICLN